MCGISGFYSPIPIASGVRYYKAHSLLRHRGPDDEGFIITGKGINPVAYKGDDTIADLANLPHIHSVEKAEVLLGHRRLSIIDLTKEGHQPRVDPTGRYSMVFNGEIFNYLELKQELQTLGVNFLGASDTEVLLQAYINWGTKCFNKLNGMWAVAIYDNMADEMIVSRDRFGIKPLFYCARNNSFAFASEYKFIRAFDDAVAFTVNEQRLGAYVQYCNINNSSDTLWNEINELTPGHFLKIKSGKIKTEIDYWEYRPESHSITESDALEQLRWLIEDSIKLRMRSDVEVGSLLSGGLDSNTILFALKKLGFLSDGRYKTFSAVFKEQEFSEQSYINEAVKRAVVSSYYIYPTEEDANSYLNELLYHNEDPFRSFAVLSQYLLYKKIRTETNVKVVLNGQGADELFCGYTNHYYAHFANLLKTGKITRLMNEGRAFMCDRGVSLQFFIRNLCSYFLSAVSSRNYLENYNYNHLTRPLREYLKYDDRNSMAFGIEARVPFLDYRIVEFAFSLPMSMKIDASANKKILRDYAKPIVPSMITERKDKMGFVSPQEK